MILYFIFWDYRCPKRDGNLMWTYSVKLRSLTGWKGAFPGKRKQFSARKSMSDCPFETRILLTEVWIRTRWKKWQNKKRLNEFSASSDQSCETLWIVDKWLVLAVRYTSTYLYRTCSCLSLCFSCPDWSITPDRKRSLLWQHQMKDHNTHAKTRKLCEHKRSEIWKRIYTPDQLGPHSCFWVWKEWYKYEHNSTNHITQAT